jgi:hypothetical protein
MRKALLALAFLTAASSQALADPLAEAAGPRSSPSFDEVKAAFAEVQERSRREPALISPDELREVRGEIGSIGEAYRAMPADERSHFTDDLGRLSERLQRAGDAGDPATARQEWTRARTETRNIVSSQEGGPENRTVQVNVFTTAGQARVGGFYVVATPEANPDRQVPFGDPTRTDRPTSEGLRQGDYTFTAIQGSRRFGRPIPFPVRRDKDPVEVNIPVQ